MKKVVFAVVAALVVGTTAMASDIAISTQAGWFGQGAADREMQEIVTNVKGITIERFAATDHAALAEWVKDHTGDGVSDLLILCGQFPDTIYKSANAQPDGSLAELFLDDGNCIINTGDYMFYVVNGAGSNAEPGLEAMMDIAHIAMWDDDTPITITADGKKYAPSLVDYACDRPWHLDELSGDWYAELIMGQNAAGTRAEPAIITNRVTGGRLGTFYQTASQDDDPRGEVISEWIKNWYIPNLGGANPFARSANPKDRAIVDQTMLQASWKAGDLAVLHDVYFGEDFDQVSAATPSDTAVYVGRQATTQLIMGMVGGTVAPNGLAPGKTYYWRVDEVKDGDPASPWKGKVWSFTVRPMNAFSPTPADGMKYVDPNQNLIWDKGLGTAFHTMFFGQSFDEVNNAVAGIMTADTQYDPGTLALETTYYWRVDEFAFPAATTTKGSVWSFTTIGTGGGARAVYFSGMGLEGEPILTQVERTINHSWGDAVVAGDLADGVSARWTANLEVPTTGTYRIITSTDDGVRLWFDGRLVINGWIDQGTTDYVATLDLVAGQIYSIRMEYYENGGGAVAQLSWEGPGLARQIIPEGWLQLPVRATVLSPAHLEAHAVQDAPLRWIAGEEATHHDVYLGEDEAAVANADTTTAGIYKGRQPVEETSFDAGSLEWGKTYFWRIDEINEANPDSPWKGSVWSFTAADFLIVDDMESYTDEEGVGARIYETWIDGYLDQSSGSTVGNITAPFAEQTIVHGGRQSMPLDYNNVNTPYYSEATREWDAAQNWKVNGVDTLTVHFRGNAANGQEKVYVTLTDSTNKSATVVHPDSAIAASTEWIEWKVPLANFTGVNGGKIKKMVIGLGDRAAPKQGGAGRLYVDDIWVTTP